MAAAGQKSFLGNLIYECWGTIPANVTTPADHEQRKYTGDVSAPQIPVTGPRHDIPGLPVPSSGWIEKVEGHIRWRLEGTYVGLAFSCKFSSFA